MPKRPLNIHRAIAEGIASKLRSNRHDAVVALFGKQWSVLVKRPQPLHDYEFALEEDCIRLKGDLGADGHITPLELHYEDPQLIDAVVQIAKAKRRELATEAQAVLLADLVAQQGGDYHPPSDEEEVWRPDVLPEETTWTAVAVEDWDVGEGGKLAPSHLVRVWVQDVFYDELVVDFLLIPYCAVVSVDYVVLGDWQREFPLPDVPDIKLDIDTPPEELARVLVEHVKLVADAVADSIPDDAAEPAATSTPRQTP